MDGWGYINCICIYNIYKFIYKLFLEGDFYLNNYIKENI